MRSALFRRPAIACTVAAVVAASAAAAVGANRIPAPLSGDRVLAAAVAAPQLRSYSVPVHFNVHLRKPIGIRTKVEAVAYFRAPAQTALVIVHASGLVGAFFKGAYKLDMVPQAWPYTYHVLKVARSVQDGAPVELLTARPRSAVGDLTDVLFTLDVPGHRPLAAQWHYTGGGSIRLTFGNGRVGAYMLPQRATVSVDMPHDKLDADATYGAYALNAPIADDAFTAAR